MTQGGTVVATTNLLLDSLSEDSLKGLLTRMRPVVLPLRTVLYEPEIVPAYAYFLTSGIASVVTSSADGGVVEVEVVGREGVVGALHLLGSAVVPTQCFMQLAGTALRIRLVDLRAAFLESGEIRGRLLEFVQVQSLTLSQIAGCHRLHEAEQRLARWLLMVQDRVQQETLELTQTFLAEMLGSQRTTVSAVAADLQRKGLIEYSRGHVRILDRKGLESAVCECYGVTRDLLANLYR
nr:Crp/Fnr family transcriptional regulator [Granulicella arctica]